MRTAIVIGLVVLLAGIVIFGLVPLFLGPQQWEYAVVPVRGSEPQALASMGEDGWELAGVTDRFGVTTFYFKRRAKFARH